MDDARTAELHTLRARAYGRDADIDSDPEAQRRLSELEAARAAESAPTPASEPPAVASVPSETAPAVPARAPEPSANAAVPIGVPAAVSEAETRRAARSRAVTMGLTWAGSLAAVAALAVSITAAASVGSAWPVSSASGQDVFRAATLRAMPDVAAPDPFQLGGGGVMFEPFEDLVVFESRFPDEAKTRCLMLADETAVNGRDDEGFVSGYLMQGCGAGAFPAVLSIVVDAQLPAGVRERYPVGSSLQFVLEADLVSVYAADPPTTAAGGVPG